MSGSLDLKRKLRYADYKQRVVEHSARVKDWAADLLVIKTEKLWDCEFDSWEAFLKKYVPWSISAVRAALAEERDSQAGRLITDTTGEPIIRPPKITRETKVKPTPPIAQNTSIEENKNNSQTPEKPAKVFDITGREVHPTILELYQRKDEFQPFLTAISQVRCAIEKAWKGQDPLYDVIEQDALVTLNMAYHHISSARLIYVCGFCQGTCKVTKQECPHCHDRGLMTKNQWDMNVPIQTRTMIANRKKQS